MKSYIIDAAQHERIGLGHVGVTVTTGALCS